MLPAPQQSEEPSKKMGLRERKHARTHQTILNSAWFLFTRDGVDATSVRSIAELAEVSEVTLYSYFKSKQILIDAVMSQQASMERVIHAIQERPEDEGPIEALRAIHRAQADTDPEAFSAYVKTMAMINADPTMQGAYHRSLPQYVNELVDALMPRAARIGMSRHELAMFCYAFNGMVDALSEEPSALESPQAWADATDWALSMLANGWGASTP